MSIPTKKVENSIKIVLKDGFNGRKVTFSTTFDGENIGDYREAFDAFLLAVGFAPGSVRGEP